AGYTLKKDEHVRIDLIYSKYSEKNKLIVDIAGGILFSLVFIISVFWVSTEFALDSFLMGETSADPGGLPYRFIIKAVLPLGFLLLLIETVSQILKSIVKLREITGASKSV
ncbi:MAG: TRAP transporter small permease subunit, partial [Ignavibacteriaceae bacterium]|nr:TRAP transporter small permease subunit [Ignavibacteriaceae bacterium]